MTITTIRKALVSDRAAILQLVPRLRAFGEVRFHAAADLDAGECRTINRFFESPVEGTQLWVAEHPVSGVSGAAYAERVLDYFTREPHAHLGILMVAKQAEGTGVARALIDQVERWSHENGLKRLTLNVFATNARARGFYEHLGFDLDVVRYAKIIDDRSTD